MGELLADWGTQIVLSLVIAILTYFLNKNIKAREEQNKHFQELLQAEQDTSIREEIEVQLDPIYKELEDIRKRILSLQDKEIEDHKESNENFQIILASYKYRLTQLCKELLNQGFMYQYQYDNLNEFYTIYHKMGGNGQAKEYYDKVCDELRIKPNPEK